MKIVLSNKELEKAIVEYVAKNYPNMTGKAAYITVENAPLTHDEWAAANNGLRVVRRMQAVIDCPEA